MLIEQILKKNPNIYIYRRRDGSKTKRLHRKRKQNIMKPSKSFMIGLIKKNTENESNQQSIDKNGAF